MAEDAMRQETPGQSPESLRYNNSLKNANGLNMPVHELSGYVMKSATPLVSVSAGCAYMLCMELASLANIYLKYSSLL